MYIQFQQNGLKWMFCLVHFEMRCYTIVHKGTEVNTDVDQNVVIRKEKG